MLLPIVFNLPPSPAIGERISELQAPVTVAALHDASGAPELSVPVCHDHQDRL